MTTNKLYENNFEYILSQKLRQAYQLARKNGKRKTIDEHIFEINEFENLVNLRKSLLNRTYEPSRSVAHIVKKPVRREIFAAPFRDRVVHHLLFEETYSWWDKRFIYDSYSCRVGKGVLFGIQRLDKHIRKVSKNYAVPTYILKLDVQGYFMSLPRERLLSEALAGLDKQYDGRKNDPMYKLLKFLWQQIILDDPVNGARRKGNLSDWDKLPVSKSLFSQPPGRGIVIGNLTSQLLSNIYLNKLDRFVTMDLGYKHYGRYVDDFYIVVNEKQLPQLKRDICLIRDFLESLELTLHPKKRLLREIHQGVPFLGVVLYPNRIIPGARLTKNAYQAFREVVSGERGIETVPSYMGHVKYFNSYKLMQKLFDEMGWDYEADNLYRNPRQKL